MRNLKQGGKMVNKNDDPDLNFRRMMDYVQGLYDLARMGRGDYEIEAEGLAGLLGPLRDSMVRFHNIMYSKKID
jgi:hypothetical protein